MSERRIATVVAVEGEREYRAAMVEINAENKTLASSLKLVESEFRNSANTMEALSAKSEALAAVEAKQSEKVRTLSDARENAARAVQQYKQNIDELNAAISKNQAALEKLEQQEGDTTEEQARLNEQITQSETELGKQEAALSAAERGVNTWEDKLNRAKIELNNTNDEIKQNEQYMDEARTSTDGCATSIDQYGRKVKAAGDNAEEAGKKSKKFGEDAAGGISMVDAALISVGIEKMLRKIGDAFVECGRAAIEFESGVTGIAKTTDLTASELGAMGDAIKRLSTEIPQTTTELAKIAENAGQLGVEKESILGFTRTIADLGATTDMVGEQAAQTFAKFANITGMAQTDFDRLGSSVVALGNSLATNEAAITEMALNLAAAGTQAGMTQGTIVGLAGALSSVGMEARAGGTAFSKVINEMTVAVETGSDRLQDFANIAGMSAEEFAKAYREDAGQAIQAFISGLDNMEAHGKSATVLLEELGLTERNVRDSLTRAAEANDLFTSSIALGNQAWEENTALMEEAELRYGTTESRLTMLGNAFNNVKIAIGDQLKPVLDNLLDIGMKILNWLEEFINQNEWVGPLLMSVGAAVGVLAAALGGMVILSKIIPLLKSFAATLMANPILLVVTAVTAAVAALYAFASASFEADAEARQLSESSKQLAADMQASADAFAETTNDLAVQAGVADKLINRLDELGSKSELTAAEQAELRGAVQQLNEMYPELNLAIDENTGKLSQNTDEIKESVAAMQERMEQIVEEERYLELLREKSEAEVQLAENERKRKELLAGLNEEQIHAVEVLTEVTDRQWGLGDITRMLTGDTGVLVVALEDLNKGDAELQEQIENTSASMQYHEERINGVTDATHLEKQAVIESTEAKQLAMEAEAELQASLESMAEILEMLAISEEDYTAATRDMTGAERDLFDATLVLEAAQYQLKTAYEETYTTIYTSIMGQMGLLTEMDNKTKETAASINKNLESQVTWLDNYSQNWDNLLGRNIEGIEILLREVSDGSAESAEILAGLATASDDELRAIIANMKGVEERTADLTGKMADFEMTVDQEFGDAEKRAEEFSTQFIDNMGKTQEGADKFKATVDKMVEDFGLGASGVETRLDEMVQNMNKAEDAAKSGAATGQGFLTGMSSMEQAIINKASAMARAAATAMNKELKISSPSDVTRQTGRNAGKGVIVGFEDEISEAEHEAARFAMTMDETYRKTMEALQNQPWNMFPQQIYESSSVHNGGDINMSVKFDVHGNVDRTTKDEIIYDIRKELGRLVRI